MCAVLLLLLPLIIFSSLSPRIHRHSLWRHRMNFSYPFKNILNFYFVFFVLPVKYVFVEMR